MFAVPGVQGCGEDRAWQSQVDGAIDVRLGLPSQPGQNSARIDGRLFIAPAASVRENLGP
jgi:hypothetical protein